MLHAGWRAALPPRD